MNNDKFVIKNTKYNVYFCKVVSDNSFHFVRSLSEAKIFKDEAEAKKVLQETFKNSERYIIVKC